MEFVMNEIVSLFREANLHVVKNRLHLRNK